MEETEEKGEEANFARQREVAAPVPRIRLRTASSQVVPVASVQTMLLEGATSVLCSQTISNVRRGVEDGNVGF